MPADSYEQDREDFAVGERFDRESTESEALEAIELGAAEEEPCTHLWPNGISASHINLETCYIECAICGQPLADINYQFPPALRARRERSAA